MCCNILQLHFRFTTADAHRVRSRNLQRSDGKEPEEQPTQKQGEVRESGIFAGAGYL